VQTKQKPANVLAHPRFWSDYLLSQLGDNRTDVARRLFRTIAWQIFLHNTFDADPHPGNILVLSSGEIVLIEFGLVGRLNVLERTALRDLLVTVERQNPVALTDALLEITSSRQEHDPEHLQRILSQFMARRLGQGMGTGTALFTDLFQIMLDFGLAFPRRGWRGVSGIDHA
jgi:ubiquinone biosynthesis protein